MKKKTHAIHKENESEIEVSPKFYQNIIEMSCESTKEMKGKIELKTKL